MAPADATEPEFPKSTTQGGKPRTKTGCLTCRKRKVKCGEEKPHCLRCCKLQRECTWGDLAVTGFYIRNPDIGLQDLDTASLPYICHFTTFCCRFLAYSNDDNGNPFQDELVPLAGSSSALLHSMAALAAGHLARSQPQHQHNIAADAHYSRALSELSRTLLRTLSDPRTVRSDATLGACLLLCIYEILYSDNGWLTHLLGARDLIQFRGGPRADYLTRFFSLLDISGSLSSGAGPLLRGDYWLDDDASQDSSENSKFRPWPYYETDTAVVNYSHKLMIYMAKLSHLSSESMGQSEQDVIAERAQKIHDELLAWWQSCPSSIRDQRNDWRRQGHNRKLTVPETLREEAFSSIRSRVQGCILYLNHMLDPRGRGPQKLEDIDAIKDILEIAEETPEECGLEMGIYWGLFMAGVAIFNNHMAEDIIRRKLKAKTTSSLWHADRALYLLEVLWQKQHLSLVKDDWREVQKQMQIQM
ncbi:uncharacterized protein K444DRAFT_400147 [Hyaloscypha bicolor E]|uniref:Zn(2)-C6 fungal-type domain-containing protein n=1 Tax=Hyaloscypha bicolor E TaxID=1095630 RepID=A0A2J6TB79_9HELO|nr:uncharacterized protein K444DRAFT_400147 [Hyaloscypha bicolor E]PMD60275.1 hypothetical protein K444DRAFT_400147 [Hyaloscypha bicolor E]